MDDALILTIIITIGVVVIICPIVFVIIKFTNKKIGDKYKRKSKFNDIKKGMSETELYSMFGKPNEIIEVDSTAKIVTYYEKKHKLLFTHSVIVDAQVKIKDGVVIDVTVSSDFSSNLIF